MRLEKASAWSRNDGTGKVGSHSTFLDGGTAGSAREADLFGQIRVHLRTSQVSNGKSH